MTAINNRPAATQAPAPQAEAPIAAPAAQSSAPAAAPADGRASAVLKNSDRVANAREERDAAKTVGNRGNGIPSSVDDAPSKDPARMTAAEIAAQVGRLRI